MLSQPAITDAPAQPQVDNRLLVALSACSAVGVALIYFPQSLVHEIALSFEVSAMVAAGAVAAPQLGYALGIVLLVPLVDSGHTRQLIAACLLGAATSAVAAATSTSTTMLLGASLLMGCCAVVAPMAAPFATTRTALGRRGRVSAILLAASVAGIFLARSLATAATPTTWRAGYLVAAATCVLVAAWTWHAVPPTAASGRVPWLRQLSRPVVQVRTRPDLRRSVGYQMGAFAGFTGVWATAELVLVNDLAYRSGTMAVVNLAALFTILAVPLAGSVTDRYGPDRVNSIAFAGMAASAVFMCGVAVGDLAGLVSMLFAVLLLDVSMQSGMVANMVRIYAACPGEAGAASTAYMAAAFTAGSAGSWCATHLYLAVGWQALPALILLSSGVPALFHIRHAKSDQEHHHA